MKSLRDHNQEIKEREEAFRNINLCGVACDMCETPMVYSQRTSPIGAGQHVHCPSCGYRGVMQS